MLDVIDLGVLPGGRTSEARRVNDVGIVVGTSDRVVDPEGFFRVSRAITWQNGEMVDATSDGLNRDLDTWGFGINAKGVVAGRKDVHDGSEPFAIAWQANQVVFSMPASLRPSEARDINDAGVIAGWSFSSDMPAGLRATSWQNGVATELPMLSGAIESRAYAINNNGDVVGYDRGPQTSRAFLVHDGAVTELPGLAPGVGTFAYDISTSGFVVGRSGDHAVVWKDAVPTGLPPLLGGVSSSAEGVNDAGHVVGYSGGRAIIWIDGVPYTLPPLNGFTSSRAFGINNRGYVVGSSGGSRATLWIINTPPTPATGGSYEGKKKKPVTFDATRTVDAEHDGLSYTWDFGDGSAPASGAKVGHVYADHGTYTVTLTVTDARGLSATSTTTAQIGPIKKGRWRSPHVPD